MTHSSAAGLDSLFPIPDIIPVIKPPRAARHNTDKEPMPEFDPVAAAQLRKQVLSRGEPLYLAASSSSFKHMHENMHVMIGPRQSGLRPLYEGRLWGGDNDAYVGRFSLEAFTAHLERLIPFEASCLFVALPDFVHDPGSTFALWTAMRPVLTLAYPMFQYAFVAQTGATPRDIPDDADVLFLAGEDEWRQGPAGAALIQHAHEELGIPVHVGRVNSAERLVNFARMGAQSMDGTHLSFKGLPGAAHIDSWLSVAQTRPDDLWSLRDVTLRQALRE